MSAKKHHRLLRTEGWKAIKSTEKVWEHHFVIIVGRWFHAKAKQLRLSCRREDKKLSTPSPERKAGVDANGVQIVISPIREKAVFVSDRERRREMNPLQDLNVKKIAISTRQALFLPGGRRRWCTSDGISKSGLPGATETSNSHSRSYWQQIVNLMFTEKRPE